MPRTSDLRGAVQLAAEAAAGVSRIAEGVHQSVWSVLGVPGGKTAQRTGGLTGLIYASVRGVAQLLGKGVDTLLATLRPLLDSADAAPPDSSQREAVLAALNGVMGDRLAASHNPLATPMTLRFDGAALDWQALPPGLRPTGKVLLLVHGLCMNELQWQRHPAPPAAGAIGHAQALASAFGYTPVYLRYNTGLHISQNGRELAAQLTRLAAHWPVPLEEIAVLAHSMGGLVTRSAVHYAVQQRLHWLAHLKHMVFLGTPHHGAPLERAGNWVDVLLGSTPFSKPFARLTALRSAGITDLRYGNLMDADWQGQVRSQAPGHAQGPAQAQLRRSRDRRVPVPLPDGIACYAAAAAVAAKRSLAAERLTGDGLVPLRSALGQHDDAQRHLHFAKAAQAIFYRTGHIALLHSPAVTAQLMAWLTPARAGQ